MGNLLSLQNLALTIASVVGISIGQLFLKQAAMQISGPLGLGLVPRLFTNGWLLLGGASFLISVGLWLIVLRTTPLAIVYPFMSLAFLIVPVLSSLAFGEALTASKIVGGLVIMLGVIISVR